MSETTADEFDDDDREFILNQLNDVIKFIREVLKKKHSNITEKDVEYWLKLYLD